MDLTDDKSDLNMNQIQHLTHLSAFDQMTQNRSLNTFMLTRKAHHCVTAREISFIILSSCYYCFGQAKKHSCP